MAREELRFTGAGGQGIILATIVIAEACFNDKKSASQCQSYGPEARGGLCKAECIIDDKEIAYPRVQDPSFLLCLTQASFDKYISTVKAGTMVMVDSSITVPEDAMQKYKVYSLPILQSAKEVLKTPMSANIISCGAVNECLKLASEDSLKKATLAHIPKGTDELNFKALALGRELFRRAK